MRWLIVLFAAFALLGLWDITRALWFPGWWLPLALVWAGYAGLVWLAWAGWRNRRGA